MRRIDEPGNDLLFSAAISSAHAAAVSDLPPLHHDPFDRILLAQARTEGLPLLTADAKLTAYGDPVVGVG